MIKKKIFPSRRDFLDKAWDAERLWQCAAVTKRTPVASIPVTTTGEPPWAIHRVKPTAISGLLGGLASVLATTVLLAVGASAFAAAPPPDSQFKLTNRGNRVAAGEEAVTGSVGSVDPFARRRALRSRDGRTALMLAHAILVKSNPEQEATIQEAPETVQLWFNEGVGKRYIALAVINSEGKRVDKKDAKQGFFDKSFLSVSLPPIPPGKYAVRYRVQSADGHIITGKYYFTLKQ